MTTLGLKNVNMLTKEQYDGVPVPATDELYAISGAGFGFPSNRYDDLELGASGTTYTAPANGYFYVGKATAAVNQFLNFTNVTRNYEETIQPYVSGAIMRNFFPVQKGDICAINYNASGATNIFRFIYAEGE